MDKSIKALIVTCLCIWLFGSCIITKLKAEDVVTGNILPNAGNAVSSYNGGSTSVISDNTSNTTLSNNATIDGFTVTCNTANGQNGGCGAFFTYDKAVEAAHDLKLTTSASLVGINGTGQTSNEIIASTVAKLDQGITLNNTIDMQNCEWSGSAFACGDSTGAADSYTIKVRILDNDDEELASVTQTRTTDAGYNANSKTFTDQLIYTGMGAYKYEWSWEGIDGSGSTQSHSNQRGPNLLGAQLLMTFNSEDFTYISTESQTSLTSLEEILEELETNIFEEIFEEIAFEEEISFTMTMEEIEEVIETMSFEPSMTMIEETVEETIFEEPMEEIYEETQEITASFLPMVSEEEEVAAEEEETISGSVSMESAEEEVEEEMIEEEQTEMVEETHEEEKIIEKEEAKEKKSTSKTAKKSAVQTKKTAKQKKIQQKKAIFKNIDRIMDKVDSDIKDMAKNLQIKNIIKLDAMASEQASLDLYRNAIFYRPKNIYLDQLNIFDPRQIYPNVNLASYVNNDKIAIKAKALEKIQLEKRRLQIELEQLKNG
jgi:hypothetical protein